MEDPLPLALQRRRHRAVGLECVPGEYLGEAEVQDLDVVVRRQLDVGRLEVTMDDSLLVSFLEG